MNPIFYVSWPIAAFGLILIPFILSIARLSSFFGSVRKEKKESPEILLDHLMKNSTPISPNRKPDYPEVLFMGIAPLVGSMFIHVFQKEILPFNIGHSLTLLTYILIPFLSYWVSRFWKESLPNWIIYGLQAGMSVGCLLYPMLFLHFCSGMTIYGVGILPFFGFPLVAPLPALGYTIREIYLTKVYLREQLHFGFDYKARFSQFKFRLTAKQRGMLVFILLVGALQIILQLAGQEWNSIFLAFTESKNFLFSNVHNAFPF